MSQLRFSHSLLNQPINDKVLKGGQELILWDRERSAALRALVNWLCDIRTRAGDNLHTDVPCQRLETHVLRHRTGKSELFLTLRQSHLTVRGDADGDICPSGPQSPALLLWYSSLPGFDLFRPSTSIDKCRGATLAAPWWVWSPPGQHKCCLRDSGVLLFHIITLLQR